MTEILVIVANSFISDHDDVGGSVCTHPVCVIVLVTNIIIVHCVL